MKLGEVVSILPDKNLVCLHHTDETYSIGIFYDTEDISKHDIIDAERLLGDVLVINKTKGKYVQLKFRYLGLTEKKMKQVMEDKNSLLYTHS